MGARGGVELRAVMDPIEVVGVGLGPFTGFVPQLWGAGGGC